MQSCGAYRLAVQLLLQQVLSGSACPNAPAAFWLQPAAAALAAAALAVVPAAAVGYARAAVAAAVVAAVPAGGVTAAGLVLPAMLQLPP